MHCLLGDSDLFRDLEVCHSRLGSEIRRVTMSQPKNHLFLIFVQDVLAAPLITFRFIDKLLNTIVDIILGEEAIDVSHVRADDLLDL